MYALVALDETVRPSRGTVVDLLFGGVAGLICRGSGSRGLRHSR
jgi:hypothetical protein